MLSGDVTYVSDLVAKGGPEVTEWGELTRWISDIAERRRSGRLSEAELASIRNAFGPAFSEATMQGFAYRKPHGYAGDFEIIERVYSRYLAPPPLTSWDEYLQSHAAAEAVRNRKQYFHALLSKLVSRKPGATVLNVASGPGRDMYEWLSENSDADLRFECVEFDHNAVQYAARLNQQHLGRIAFHNVNAFRFRPDKHYDFVWAAGLFDYFGDAAFVRLLARLLRATRHTGEVVIGNFSRANPSRDYMELFEWHLTYRDPHDLKSLAVEAGADPALVHVGQEPLGVNLFLHCTVPPN